MTGVDYRARRLKLSMSQSQLGRAVGVDKMTIYHRERGDIPIMREAELAIMHLRPMRRGGRGGTRLPARTAAAACAGHS